MRFDSGTEQAAKAGVYNDELVIKQKDLDFDIPYRFRVLPLVIPVHRVMYPCIAPDNENGGTKSSWRSLKLPHDYDPLGWAKEPTVYDFISEIDMKVRKDNAVGSPEEVKGFFNVQKIWVFPVIDRRESELVVKYFEVGWNIFSSIREIQNGLDSDDTSKLAHGPIWVHDVVVRKKKKKEGTKAQDWQNIKYTAESYKGNKFAGKIDASVLENEAQQKELFKKAVGLGIFSEEEKQLLDAFGDGNAMIAQYAPMSSAEVTKMFTEFPIDLSALDRNNNPVFPNQLQFMEQLAKKELSYMSVGTGGAPKAALPPPDDNDDDQPAMKNPAMAEHDIDEEEGDVGEFPPKDEVVKKLDPKKEIKPKAKSSGDLPSFMSELDD